MLTCPISSIGPSILQQIDGELRTMRLAGGPSLPDPSQTIVSGPPTTGSPCRVSLPKLERVLISAGFLHSTSTFIEIVAPSPHLYPMTVPNTIILPSSLPTATLPHQDSSSDSRPPTQAAAGTIAGLIQSGSTSSTTPSHLSRTKYLLRVR